MNDKRKNFAGVGLLLVFLLLGSACGQKPWVAQEFQTLPSGALVDPETGEVIDPNTGTVIGSGAGGTDSAGTGTASGGLSGGTSGTSGTAGSDGTDGSGGSQGDGPGGSGAPGPNDPNAPTGGNATGVSKTSIKIGFHAPLTGAAPVPSDSVSKGKDLYFRYYPKVVNGRNVEVVLKNDQYNPSSAVAVCKEMVEKDKVFLLSGAAGTDQIAACARYAESVAVPYLSAGVTEAGLTGLRTYFATTMTYPDQGPLLADYMASKLGAKGEANGMLWFNTPSFQDAHNAWVSAMGSQGADVAYDRAYSKGSGDQQAIQAVSEMKRLGIENVYVLTSPTWFLRVLTAARNQQYEPQWVGVGITMTFDTVASVGCRSGTLNGAKFFSPFPAWVDSKKFDPNFAKAVAKLHPEENGGDDFMWLSWAISKVGTELMKIPGGNLTRERFIYFAERAQGLKTGVFPELNFTPSDRFGSSQVHVNQAQCSDNRWHTIQSFASNF